MASDGDNVERLIDLGIVPTLINLLQVNSVFVIYKVCLYRKKLDVICRAHHAVTREGR